MNSESQSWCFYHPSEISITFFIPLPDPLSLADGWTSPTYAPLTYFDIEKLNPWLSEMVLHDTNGLREPRWATDDFGQAGVQNFVDKFLFDNSIRVHQTFERVSSVERLTPVLSTVKEQLLIGVSASHRTSGPDGQSADDHSISVHRAVGDDVAEIALSVAEVSMGLRLIGEVPRFEEPLLFSSDLPDLGEDRLEKTRREWDYVEFDPRAQTNIVEERIETALLESVNCVARLQRATHLLRNSSSRILTPERLPLLTPAIVRHWLIPARDYDDPVFFCALPPRPSLFRVVEPLAEEQAPLLNMARERSETGPMAVHADIRREAQVALERGDRRVASLLAGVGAETMLDELLLHLWWEEGRTPEWAASEWRGGVRDRVARELPPRLGGDWTKSDAPVAIWTKEISALRNSVAHAGYAPSRREARDALQAVDRLVSELCDRMASPKTRNSFPRTAMMLVGEGGLKRRNALTNRLHRLTQDPLEVAWAPTFARWREAWLRLRQDRISGARVPRMDRSVLLFVRNIDGSHYWVLHDWEQRIATTVSPDEQEFSEGFRQTLSIMKERGLAPDGVSGPVSSLVPRVSVSLLKETWVEDYRLLPLMGVMVDASDLNVDHRS